jgi:hypothetical protein
MDGPQSDHTLKDAGTIFVGGVDVYRTIQQLRQNPPARAGRWRIPAPIAIRSDEFWFDGR